MAKHGVPGVADWRELLGKVDLVSVCSPAVTHAAIVRAFLNAGAHVLVEKPIATNIEEADALIALAEQDGRVLTVGHQERFVFAHTGLLDYDDAPLEVSCWRKGPWTGRGADVSVVLDLMIHDLDLVHQLIPGRVARCAGARPDRESRICRRSVRRRAIRERRRGAARDQPHRRRTAAAACARSMRTA